MAHFSRRAIAFVLGMALTSAVAVGGAVVALGSPSPDNTGPSTPRGAGPNTPQTTPSPPEAVFVPITPCRIIDTRKAGGVVKNGSTRSFRVLGTDGFAGQGGRSGGCGIPATASAVTVAMTAMTPSGLGYLRAGPTPAALATVVSFQTRISQTTGLTLTLGGTDSTGNFVVTPSGGNIGLAMDVNGYFDLQMHAIVLADGTLYWGSNRVLSTTHTSAGHYTVTFDRDLTGCTVIGASDGDDVMVLPGWSGATVDVQTDVLSSGAWVAADRSFQLSATC